MRFVYLFLKRLFDIVCALAGLVVTFPLWIVTVIGILLSDPGPIFYIARRTTKDDRVFSMLKFRSMRQGEANEAVFRGEEDRIFPFGAFIRATKMDEMPQLLNILVGDMSIVGPRPAAPQQLYIVRAGRFARTSRIQAGLTGPSALYDYLYGDHVRGEDDYYRDVLPNRLELDLLYCDRRGIGFDLKMIWWTVVCIACTVTGHWPERTFRLLIDWADEHRRKEEAAWTEG